VIDYPPIKYADDVVQDHPRPRPQTVWNAADLMAATFPAMRWAVPGVVAEGLTVVVGPPKVGKSWLCWGLAVAVASGGVAFGKVPVEAGDVLYLALEDTPRRLQSRLGKVLQRDPAPHRLTIRDHLRGPHLRRRRANRRMAVPAR
jgi:Mrp family chromosome partitioning ATPase